MFAQWNVSWIFVEQHIASENRHGTVGSSIEMRFCSVQKLWSTNRGKKKSIKAKVSSWMTKNFFRCAHELTLKSPLYQNFPFAQPFTSVSSPWLVYCSRLLLRTLFAFYALLFFSSLLLSFGEAHKTIFYLPLRSVSSILSHRWDSLRLFRYWPDSLKQTPLDWHFFNYHSNNECIFCFVLISRKISLHACRKFDTLAFIWRAYRIRGSGINCSWVVVAAEMSTFRQADYPIIHSLNRFLQMSSPDSFFLLCGASLGIKLTTTHQHILWICLQNVHIYAKISERIEQRNRETEKKRSLKQHFPF